VSRGPIELVSKTHINEINGLDGSGRVLRYRPYYRSLSLSLSLNNSRASYNGKPVQTRPAFQLLNGAKKTLLPPAVAATGLKTAPGRSP
jgi:hypothetical protein